MKNTSTKTNELKTAVLLKAFDLELKAILENDLKNFTAAKYNRNKNAAFLQLIAA